MENEINEDETPMPPKFTIPQIDLAAETERQIIVDREPGQYLGHVTTVLLEDGKTILIVYPKGHGIGPIVYKRSTDGGQTWSERLPTPKSWETSDECPTLYRTVDRQGKRRLILFSSLAPIRSAYSEDDGRTFTELKPMGNFGGVVGMASLLRLKNGDYMAFFHDNERYIGGTGERGKGKGGKFTVYGVRSADGGLTWGTPRAIVSRPDVNLCEPGAVRSPDGKQVALLLRENKRVRNSFVTFSDDEGETWTPPRELPAALTGDRHTPKYTADGRLFISFRDMGLASPTHGDWVAWVGTYDDIVKGREGQYRLRLMDNHYQGDCAYPGVEILPDDTIVTTTYGHWTPGEKPYIVSVRLRLDEMDKRFRERRG
jgi:hypothetical protein